jgi:hypothetical protein
VAVAVAAAVAVGALCLPVLLLLLGVLAYPLGLVVRLLGSATGAAMASGYGRLVEAAIAPGPLWDFVWRLAGLAIFAGGAILAGSSLAARRGDPRRRDVGAWWWRALGPWLDRSRTVEHFRAGLWHLVRGAGAVGRPGPGELGQAYGELLSENLDQPGFREIILVAHDLDARGDVVFALLDGSRRTDFFSPDDDTGAEARQAETIDLAGVGRPHLEDALAAACSIESGTAPHLITFAPDSYWRGETHRLCDRPASIGRLLEELPRAAVEQVILVTTASARSGPHGLTRRREDFRGQLGEHVAAAEAASVRDALQAHAGRFRSVFLVRPDHNPLGPFDFDGAYDERSDRRQTLGELMTRGYEDAYHQFIDPIVGAGGERLPAGAAKRRRSPR